MNKNDFEECVKQVLEIQETSNTFGFADIHNNTITSVIVTSEITLETLKECTKNKIDTIVTFADPKYHESDEKKIEILQRQIAELKTKNKEAEKNKKTDKKKKTESSSDSGIGSSNESSEESSEDSKRKNKKKNNKKNNKKNKDVDKKDGVKNNNLKIGNDLVAESLQKSQLSVFVIDTYANKTLCTNVTKQLKLMILNRSDSYVIGENKYTLKEIMHILMKMMDIENMRIMLGNDKKLSHKHKKVIFCLEPASEYHKNESISDDSVIILNCMDHEIRKRYVQRGCSVIFIEHLALKRVYTKEFASQLEEKLKKKTKEMKIKRLEMHVSKKDDEKVMIYNK